MAQGEDAGMWDNGEAPRQSRCYAEPEEFALASPRFPASTFRPGRLGSVSAKAGCSTPFFSRTSPPCASTIARTAESVSVLAFRDLPELLARSAIREPSAPPTWHT